MKKLIFVLGLGIIVAPAFVSAQGIVNFSEAKTPYGMMQYLENKALGQESYNEATDLMGKMMAGKLTETEADKLADLMNKHPGPMGMMTGQYGALGGYGMMAGSRNYSDWNNFGMRHMGYWGGEDSGAWSWVGGLLSVVWLLISILALVWLWQKVTKK